MALNQLGSENCWSKDKAQPPASHGMRLRQAVDNDGLVWQILRDGNMSLLCIGQLRIDLIADHKDLVFS